MKPLAPFLLCFAPFFVSASHAQPQPAPEINLIGEADGVKARITEARWLAAEEYQKNFTINGSKRSRIFLVRYELSAGDGPTDGYDTKFSLIDQHGQRLNSWSGSSGGGKGTAVWKDLDPRSRTAAIEWTLTKRAAPEAEGRFPLAFDFGAVAYPAPGATTEVNKTMASPRGTKLTLLSVSRAGKMGQKTDQIVLKFKAEAAADMPDLTATYNLDSRGIADDKGVDLVGNRSQGLFAQDGIITTMVEDAPAPGATALKIKITGSENAPSLAQAQRSKVVSVTFDPSLLQKPPADDLPVTTPVASGISKALDVSLAQFQQGRATLWLRDKMPGAAKRNWEVASWLSGEQNINFRPDEPQYWKENGAAPSPEESSVRVYLSPSDPIPVPATVALRPVRIQHTVLTFKDVPFPATAGETLAVNKEIPLQGGGSAVLSKVFRFDAAHPLNDSMGVFRTSKGQGLAFVVEYRAPAADNVRSGRGAAAFSINEARDDEGREIKGASPDGQMQFNAMPTDVTDPDSENSTNKQTWLRALPATGAKTVTLSGNVIVRTPEGETVNITLQ
ncbi:MAG TPA: hypothetical protein VF681_13430 [Abditibacteriaceae bacterium]|jgi:hypothetical protein